MNVPDPDPSQIHPAPEPEDVARPASKNALMSAQLDMRLKMVVNGIPVHFPLKQELTQVPFNEIVTAAGKLVEKCHPTVRKLTAED